MPETPATDEAFRAIFDATLDDVRRFCVRRLPRSDVNDAISEVYLVAWRRLDQIPAEPLPWLYGVARNVVRNIERSNRRTIRPRARLAREPSASRDDDVPLIRQADDEALTAAFADLSPADREVIMLRAWEGLRAPAIAEVLDCSVSAAEKRVARAMKRLRPRYEAAPTSARSTAVQPAPPRGGEA